MVFKFKQLAPCKIIHLKRRFWLVSRSLRKEISVVVSRKRLEADQS